jgi:hypothetical protein
MANTWQDIVTAAFFGTRRYQSEEADTPLPGLNNPKHSAAHQLLDTASVLLIQQKAGWLAPTDNTILPTNEDTAAETIPVAGEAAAQMLKEILGGMGRDQNYHTALLFEWLGLAKQANQRPPANTLPALLEIARWSFQSNSFGAMLEGLGARGRWLAATNPDWQGLLAAPTVADWKASNMPNRLRILSNMRRTNPAEGRALIAAVWADEDHTMQTKMLDLMSINLSHDDEPFLEQHLDSNQEAVRKMAALRLSVLAKSAYVARMTARVTPLLSIVPAKPAPTPRPTFKSPRAPNQPDAVEDLTGKFALVLTPPPSYLPEYARDGILEKQGLAPVNNNSLALGWAKQMLAAVPPSHWEAHFKMTPNEILAHVYLSEQKQILLQGLQMAIVGHRDVRWALAILEAHLKVPPMPFDNFPIKALIEMLPHSQREAHVRLRMEKASTPLAMERFGNLMLETCDHQWSASFSQFIIEQLTSAVGHNSVEKNWPRVQSFGPQNHEKNILIVLGRVALRLDLDCLTDVRERLVPTAHTHEYWRPASTRFVEMLQFRRHLQIVFGIP